MRALDALPWPWGEDALAAVFAVKPFVRVRRLREALAWAAAHAPPGIGRWRLALASCAYHGRFVARSALLGLRSPDALRPHVRLIGDAHLAGAPRGALLLWFHLGPGAVAAALHVAGYPALWVGGRRASRSWLGDAWRSAREAAGDAAPAYTADQRAAALYKARRRLLDGGVVLIPADGGGRVAFEIDVPGGRVQVRSGWHVLRRQCAVPVLPVLAHLEGRTQVITIHPPLPSLDPDPARDLARCRDALARLVEDYVRAHPEQCYALAFPYRGPPRARAARG